MRKTYLHLLFALLLFLAACTLLLLTSDDVEDEDQAESETTSTPLELIDLSKMDVDEWASTSSDGQWIATGLVALPKLPVDSEQSSTDLSFTRVLIFSSYNSIKWPVIERSTEVNLGFPFPMPLAWSADGKFFYLTFGTTPDGCGAFNHLSGLVRVDLENGSVADLLDTTSSTWVALSPDQSMVAYTGTGGHGLILRDFLTGNESEVNIDPGKDYQAGYILWSPDGRLVTLTLVTSPCDEITKWLTSILIIDTETHRVQSLLHEGTRFLVTKEWTESQEIILVDGNYATTNLRNIPFNSQWTIDINSGAINPRER